MRLHGIDIGPVEQILVGIRVIGADAFDQVVLPHHARTRQFGGPHRHRRGRRHGDRFGRGLHLRLVAAPIRHRITALAFGPRTRSLTLNRQSSDQIGDSRNAFRRGPRRSMVTMKADVKAKARTNVRAFGNSGAAGTAAEPDRRLYSSSSGCSSGGARPSRPFKSSSSVMRSTATSVSSASTLAPDEPIKGTVSGSGSSTSTNFCREWTNSSRKSSGEMVESAISRSDTTGFLSL